MQVCSVCNTLSENKSYEAREMMFGFRDRFSYFQCSVCQCLQIAKIPEDLARFYPDNYYSFKQKNFKVRSEDYLKKKRDQAAFGKRNLLGNILKKVIGQPKYKAWLDTTKTDKNSAILDVGCGSGALLLEMANAGFKNLTGADPFIKENISIGNVSIYKKEVFELNGKFDLIMMHHVFEHMNEPLSVLKKIFTLLNSDSFLLIRIPIVSSFAWQEYKEDWVQLDAPRHFFLHSLESMNLLAKDAGFEISAVEYDATAFQFWGSIQYQNDIPLFSPSSYATNKNGSMFSTKQIEEFKKRSKQLNAEKKGDQACFYFYKN